MTTTALTTTAGSSLEIRGPAWLDRGEYPFAPRFHDSGEGRMHYVDEGEGDPILFVHGTPSWSFEWRHAIAALRGDHRCVAPDHLGFGLSDKPVGGAYRVEDHARRLRAFVEALDLRDVTLVVHDFGGPIGLPLALEGSERIRSVVVINSWMWGHADRPAIRRLSRVVASPLGRLLYLWLNASPRWLVPASFGDRAALTRPIHRHYLGPLDSRDARVAAWTLGCELAGADAFYASAWAKRAALEALPLTLVWGMRDPAFDRSYLERWEQAFGDAEVVRVEGAGHFPQEEAPEQVTAAVRAAAARGR
ncbi:MAG: alpha/beta fold hydrolase [Sandaracinaceae bacterium]|nr:alpha/beta fold hydrolase [Sandaracinaceae bacterium]